MQNTHIYKSNYRKALFAMIENINPRFFATFVFNKAEADEKKLFEVDRLKGFFAEFDSNIAGTGWYKKSFEKRLSGALFFEHVKSNIHVHSILTAPEWVSLEKLQTDGSRIWKKYVPAGNFLAKEISDVGGLNWYNTKEWRNIEFDEQVIWTNMLGDVTLLVKRL